MKKRGMTPYQAQLLGRNLKYLRTTHEIPQREIARTFDVTISLVSRWESGQRIPNVDTILRISRMYDVSMTDLITKELQDAMDG